MRDRPTEVVPRTAAAAAIIYREIFKSEPEGVRQCAHAVVAYGMFVDCFGEPLERSVTLRADGSCAIVDQTGEHVGRSLFDALEAWCDEGGWFYAHGCAIAYRIGAVLALLNPTAGE